MGAPFTLPEPDTAALARAMRARRQLESAAEHGAALLAALGLPRLVDDGFVPVDREAAGDALDAAVAVLDALDEDAEVDDLDLGEHDTTDLEPSLGWPDDYMAVPGAGVDIMDVDVEQDDADLEDDELGDERASDLVVYVFGPNRAGAAHA